MNSKQFRFHCVRPNVHIPYDPPKNLLISCDYAATSTSLLLVIYSRDYVNLLLAWSHFLSKVKHSQFKSYFCSKITHKICMLWKLQDIQFIWFNNRIDRPRDQKKVLWCANDQFLKFFWHQIAVLRSGCFFFFHVHFRTICRIFWQNLSSKNKPVALYTTVQPNNYLTFDQKSVSQVRSW